MVESSLESGNDDITSESKRIRIRREPSFSGWCDEDGDVDGEEFDFKLPLVRPRESKNAVLDVERLNPSNSRQGMEGGEDNDGAASNGLRTQNEYLPFDIENGHDSERYNSSANGLNHDDASRINKKSHVSAADVLKTLFFILVWYTFSTFLTLYNKILLGDDLGKFPAPLLMNTVHFSMQAVLSKGITWFWSDRFHPSVMSWNDYFTRVVPTALSTAMDVNLSNASLVFISVTFATMCKSASPIFLLLFAFAFRLESPSFKLLGIMMIISVGILLTVAKEAEFEFWGFLFVMLAAVMSGFRWTMTQILLQVSAVLNLTRIVSFLVSELNLVLVSIFIICVCSHIIGSFLSPLDDWCDDIKTGMKKETYGLKNPLTLMSYVTPIMAIATALGSLVFDPWHEFRNSDYFNSSWHIMRSCLLMLFGGTLAFFMVLTEYILVSVTSAVTVTIAGIVKEAVTIVVAVLYFHDKFTWLKGVGLLTIMFGVSLFNWYKYNKLQKGETSPGSSTDGPTSKYVILDEIDEEEDNS